MVGHLAINESFSRPKNGVSYARTNALKPQKNLQKTLANIRHCGNDQGVDAALKTSDPARNRTTSRNFRK